MAMPRIHAFEFNDADWTPTALKEHLVEALSRGFDWGRVLAGLVEPFQTFLAEAGATEVVDLGAGAGGPARTLARAIQRSGEKPPRFLLTDILPHVDSWAKLRTELPECIDFIAEPVDATALPDSLSAGRARLILNAFHHFSPNLASRVLADAVSHKSPVFIAEPFERGLSGAVPFLPIGAVALFANPLLAQNHKLGKAALTWMTPCAAVAGLWDNFVSSLRVYSEEELRALVAPFGSDYLWTYGSYHYAFGGQGYYFYGLHRP